MGSGEGSKENLPGSKGSNRPCRDVAPKLTYIVYIHIYTYIYTYIYIYIYIPTTRTHQRHVTIPRLDNYTHVTYCKTKNNLYSACRNLYFNLSRKAIYIRYKAITSYMQNYLHAECSIACNLQSVIHACMHAWREPFN